MENYIKEPTLFGAAASASALAGFCMPMTACLLRFHRKQGKPVERGGLEGDLASQQAIGQAGCS